VAVALTRDVPGLYLFDGATEFAGPRGILWAVWHWPALRRAMKDTAGYVAHRLWYGFPYTIGLVTWWKDEAAAYRFARTPAHIAFWSFAARGPTTRGGWLAHYRLVRGGPLWGNGVRAMTRRFGEFAPPETNSPPRKAPEPKR